ncbi:hypothetical protein SH668x_003323 [Planctomicrobium sp. SH668]|uniref:hypothetical protein n=1 Tax=Planctomicrobium sp. SH668 TaxID=3448126 RepID=UPI003F5B52D8
MREAESKVESISELHAYVHKQLCDSENLLAEQFHTQRKALFVKDKLCGIEFSLQGLRAIRLGAIWAADQNVVYFYNAKGERALKVKLKNRISLGVNPGEQQHAAAS